MDAATSYGRLTEPEPSSAAERCQTSDAPVKNMPRDGKEHTEDGEIFNGAKMCSRWEFRKRAM